MPPSTRVWLVVAITALASGCAALSGLDQYSKGDDASLADATPDQTVSDVVTKDSPTSDANDATPPDDTGVDAQDAGADDAADAAVDGDAGCGALNTVTNCSKCGATCDGTNATTTQCNGTTCQYTCKTGFSSCNNTAPDTDGCECATPSCCGSACATTHKNGIGQSYFDCIDAGTYDQTQAAKACTAYTNNQFACSAASCIGSDGGATGDLVICGNPDGGTCACWNYQGTDIGYVHQSGNTSCFCPNTNDFKWN
jgi:hypothetical protein